MTTSDWLDDDRAHCWHPYTQHGLGEPVLPVVAAEGAVLTMADGRQLIDGISSWWATLHGHGIPELVEAAKAQAEQLDHVLFAGASHEPAARLARELVEATAPLAEPDREPLTRVFYSDNGSTAVEVAMKAAYQCHLRRGDGQRRSFVALDGAYHGDTFGAMAVGDPDPFFREFGPLLFDVLRTPPQEDRLEQLFEQHGPQIAGIVLEPIVQGAAGMKAVPPAFVRRARELADQHGAFLIADEVMTGFGRTGTLFACEQADVCPDLLALAKGLTGGMTPLSVTMATESIYEAFLSEDRSKQFFHGHTFTAHPIGCAVARASLQLTRDRDVPGRLDSIGEIIRHTVESRWPDRPDAVRLRRFGGIVALDVSTTDSGYLAGLGDRLRSACRSRDDVLLRPLGNVLYAMPPAATTDEQAERLGAALADVVQQL